MREPTFDALRDRLPSWIDPAVLGWTVTLSVVLFVVSAVGLPYVLVRLPADYFVRGEEERPVHRHPALRASWLVLKNTLGLMLVVAGILMLVLPGQGLITIGVGVCLVNFPGRRRLVAWIVGREAVLRAINAFRRRRGREPLEHPPR